MKSYPEDKKSNESDWLLEDDLALLRDRSFTKALQVSKFRHIRRQSIKAVPIVLLLFAWIMFDVDKLQQTWRKKPVSNASPGNRSHASLAPSPERAPKIRILTDNEFEEMIRGYPLAIIHQDGQDHYLPLERSDVN